VSVLWSSDIDNGAGFCSRKNMTTVKQRSLAVWSRETITSYLQQIRVPLRLASVSNSGWSLLISLWYLHGNGRFYCPTWKMAKVVTHLERKPRCAFAVAADEPLYRGVWGQGKAVIIPKRGVEMLSRLLERYLRDTASPFARWLLARSQQAVTIEGEPVALTPGDYTARMRDSLLQR
jgi:hypothetical protein